MKKYLSLCLASCLCLVLISWGGKGHRITALIAENHLTPQAKTSIKELLGNESISDVASWADEVRNEQAYKYTAPWHFLNVEPGMDYKQFVETLNNLKGENVYTAIKMCEAGLKSTSTTKTQKVFALKFLIHLIGDAHQPMHVSRAEDKGGNTIQVQFLGRGTNLHTLWDSKLMDHEELSEGQMVSKLEAQIKLGDAQTYQSAEPLKWLYESYAISSKLYEEVAQNNVLDESYYTSHVDLLNQRLIVGGLRLAGVLNAIFQSPVSSSKEEVIIAEPTQVSASIKNIDVKDAANNIGVTVFLTSTAYSSRDMGSMVLVNLGAAYPNQLLTVVLRGEAKSLGNGIDGKLVSVIGTIIDYKGKPEIIVTEASKFKLGPLLGTSGGKGR